MGAVSAVYAKRRWDDARSLYSCIIQGKWCNQLVRTSWLPSFGTIFPVLCSYTANEHCPSGPGTVYDDTADTEYTAMQPTLYSAIHSPSGRATQHVRTDWTWTRRKACQTDLDSIRPDGSSPRVYKPLRQINHHGSPPSFLSAAAMSACGRRRSRASAPADGATPETIPRRSRARVPGGKQASRRADDLSHHRTQHCLHRLRSSRCANGTPNPHRACSPALA